MYESRCKTRCHKKIGYCCVAGQYFSNIMSGKESRKEGDSLEGTGNLAQEPDNQESEGIPESPNSGMAGSSGTQLSSSHQASVHGQEQEGVSRTVSSHLRSKKTTISLTDSQRGMGQSKKGAESRKLRGVKTSLSKGIESLPTPSTGTNPSILQTCTNTRRRRSSEFF